MPPWELLTIPPEHRAWVWRAEAWQEAQEWRAQAEATRLTSGLPRG